MSRLMNTGGYSHILPVLDDVGDCRHLSYVLAPWQDKRGPNSCGAYTDRDERGEPYPFKLSYFARALPGQYAWWLKWFTVARSVALGYNVMAVDSDVVVLDDWYWRVKQPPLAGYNMLSQAESDRTINGGFTYVQNAASNGPVTWLLYEAMFRMVRWAEDLSVIANASEHIAHSKAIMVDDQVMLTDTMLSCVGGRPMFWSLSFMYRQTGEAAAFRSLGLRDFAELRTKVFRVANGWERQVYNVTGPAAEHICDVQRNGSCLQQPAEGAGGGAKTTQIQTATLRMPHSGGQWPLELGGYPFGRELGPRARAYRQAFKDLGVPLPPDPEDPATQQAARATPTERFGLLNLEVEGTFLASWAETSWWAAGRFGHWHLHMLPPAGPPPLQAMGHVFIGLFPGDFQKNVALQLSGHYDWRVAARLSGSPLRVFHAQLHDKPHPLKPSTWSSSNLRLVVAYDPTAIPDDLDKRSFVAAARGLAQVATSLGAVAAWPAAPCWAQWARAKQQPGAPPPPPPPASRTHTIPWSYLDTSYTVAPFGDSLEELQCEWVGFISTGCLLPTDPSFGPGALDGGRGLLAVEFHHLRQLLGPKNASDPASDHHLASAAEEDFNDQPTGAERPVHKAAAAAAGHQQTGSRPVVVVVRQDAERLLLKSDGAPLEAANPPTQPSMRPHAEGGREGHRGRLPKSAPPPEPHTGRAGGRRRARRRRLGPSPGTTLRLGKDHEVGPAAATGSGGGGGGRPRTVSYEDLLQLNAAVVQEARHRDTATVLWLDRLVGEVEGLAGEAYDVYDRWQRRCRALSYFDLPEDQRSNWRRT